MDDFPLYSRRPSCDTLALAMCDPGLRRQHSSECEEDSLPEVYMDSGLSTLRGSHGGYDSEPEVKGQEEYVGGQRAKKKLKSGNRDSFMGENCNLEVRRSPDSVSQDTSGTRIQLCQTDSSSPGLNYREDGTGIFKVWVPDESQN